MTKHQKILILFLIFISLILKDQIFGLFLKENTFKTIENNINEIETSSLKNELEELKKAYQYTDFYEYPLEHTKVLFKTPYNYNKTITIYKGKNNDLKEDQLVVNEYGLVGIITKTFKNSSEVTLINSSNTTLPVKISNSYGTLTIENHKLIVKGIKTNEMILVGENIYTSDISNYPKNILIGKVETIKLDNYEIEQTLTVKPAVNFDNLNYLSVIKNNRGVE